MDNPEETVNSNVKALRPNTKIASDRNKELITHFIQVLGEDTASGLSIDSIQFVVMGTRKDQKGTYDSYASHYWIDTDREPTKELSYIISLLQREVQMRIMDLQGDKD